MYARPIIEKLRGEALRIYRTGCFTWKNAAATHLGYIRVTMRCNGNIKNLYYRENSGKRILFLIFNQPTCLNTREFLTDKNYCLGKSDCIKHAKLFCRILSMGFDGRKLLLGMEGKKAVCIPLSLRFAKLQLPATYT